MTLFFYSLDNGLSSGQPLQFLVMFNHLVLAVNISIKHLMKKPLSVGQSSHRGTVRGPFLPHTICFLMQKMRSGLLARRMDFINLLQMHPIHTSTVIIRDVRLHSHLFKCSFAHAYTITLLIWMVKWFFGFSSCCRIEAATTIWKKLWNRDICRLMAKHNWHKPGINRS